LEIREGLTFDDVLLVPKRSGIVTRSQTNLQTKLSRNISLNLPIISANMDTVTESAMAVAIAREGGIGIIHRFLTISCYCYCHSRFSHGIHICTYYR
jgi:IMP dehydrogenase